MLDQQVKYLPLLFCYASQVLRKKAEEKNPDEFYFSMQNELTRNGVHIQQ